MTPVSALRLPAAPSARQELIAVTLLVWLALVSIPVGLGGIGISWDALNHQFYLGWTAFSPRFDRDFLAASYQSYQYPYLYWPAYKLAALGLPGMWVGVVLVSIDVLAAPALWMVARSCVPEQGWHGTLLRAGAVVLAFAGELDLSLMDSTANDLFAAIPLVWSVAFALWSQDSGSAPTLFDPRRGVAISGFFAGLAVAFKFSNGPLVLVMPMLWLLAGRSWPARLMQVVRGTAWSIAAFLLAYGYWGWRLWEQFGNPMYPFYDPWFAAIRDAVGWVQP